MKTLIPAAGLRPSSVCEQRAVKAVHIFLARPIAFHKRVLYVSEVICERGAMTMGERKECMVAIYSDGEMKAAVCILPGKPFHEDEVAEWARDPRVTQILRVPVEVPRRFLFQQWPGLETRRSPLSSPPSPKRPLPLVGLDMWSRDR
jgi:hypothetical protein